MFVVTVQEASGAYYSKIFAESEISIGREAGNHLILPDGNVSARHSIISHRDGKFIVVDTDSTNGIYVNGRQVHGPMVVQGPNRIHIATFVLSLSTVRS